MDELKKNKLFWIVMAITFFNIGAFLLGKFIIDKTADKVIQRLQKEYSPSPYSPGFDPDKVNPDSFKATKRFFEIRAKEQGNSESVRSVDSWRDGWERERGANP